MKKIILLISIILLTGCGINFKDTVDNKYINDNKKNIESVIVTKTTLGGHDCYNVDIEEAYNAINNLKIIRKSNISVTDDYMSYIFNFNDNIKKVFSFEGEYFVYENENYKVEFDELDLKEEYLIECE